MLLINLAKYQKSNTAYYCQLTRAFDLRFSDQMQLLFVLAQPKRQRCSVLEPYDLFKMAMTTPCSTASIAPFE